MFCWSPARDAGRSASRDGGGWETYSSNLEVHHSTHLFSLAQRDVVVFSNGKTVPAQTQWTEQIRENLGILPSSVSGVMPDSIFHMVLTLLQLLQLLFCKSIDVNSQQSVSPSCFIFCLTVSLLLHVLYSLVKSKTVNKSIKKIRQAYRVISKIWTQPWSAYFRC